MANYRFLTHYESIPGMYNRMAVDVGTIALSGTTITLVPASVKTIVSVVATDQTAQTAVKAAWSGTTITFTGASGDTINYHVYSLF